MVFQYAVFAKSRSYGSRSFSSLIVFGSAMATAAAASMAATLTNARLLALRIFPRARAVIDFLEELKVLTDLSVIGIEVERFFIRPAGLVELAFVFVGDGKVVVGGGVRGVDFDRLLPPVDGFAPETTLRDVDPERDLRLRVTARIGECRRSRQKRDRRTGCNAKGHQGITLTITTGLTGMQGN